MQQVTQAHNRDDQNCAVEIYWQFQDTFLPPDPFQIRLSAMLALMVCHPLFGFLFILLFLFRVARLVVSLS